MNLKERPAYVGLFFEINLPALEESSNTREYTISPQGSLGILALGHEGIRLWRKVAKEEKDKSITSVQRKNARKKK